MSQDLSPDDDVRPLSGWGEFGPKSTLRRYIQRGILPAEIRSGGVYYVKRSDLERLDELKSMGRLVSQVVARRAELTPDQRVELAMVAASIPPGHTTTTTVHDGHDGREALHRHISIGGGAQ